MEKKRGFAICEGKGEVPYAGDVIIPRRSTKLSAGYDVFAPHDIDLMPNEYIKIDTGLKAYMQPGEVLLALPRSSLGFKYFCRLANTVGVIDADYYDNPENEGQISVEIRNEGLMPMHVEKGKAIAQFIFVPFLLADGDSFESGDKRKGGFGSTDKPR